MPKYAAVARVQWELPFPLRLPEKPFLCWEPEEGTALFVPCPGVGTLSWSRTSEIMQIEDVFGKPRIKAPSYPEHDFRIASLYGNDEIVTAEMAGGPNGGFSEPRPYSVVNIFLCLKTANADWSDGLQERAAAVLNNVIDLYRFVSLDPLAKSIDGNRVTYYTSLSLTRSSSDWPDGSAEDTLSGLKGSFGEVQFKLGLNSYDDLFSRGDLQDDSLRFLAHAIQSQQEVELFNILFFDAMRRLKRFELAMAIMDAQSAFEALVSKLLGEILTRRGETATSIEALLTHPGRFDLLQKRLVEIDRVAIAEANAAGEVGQRFLGSTIEANWRADLYRLRHKIVHEGQRSLHFDLAKRGVVAGLKAAHAVQSLRPDFNRKLMWSGSALDLNHITSTPGRFSRIFEA